MTKRQIINYSQCWEDPLLLEEGLIVNSSDRVLSIMSGGDNSLSLLLNGPKSVVSIDSNIAQKYVLELKIAAMQALKKKQLLEFLGIEKTTKRLEYYRQVVPYLSPQAATWWTQNASIIAGGVVHAGRLEKFLTIFSRYVLPLIHTQKTVDQFINSKTLAAQSKSYDRVWKSTRWRLLFRVISSRLALKKFARQHGMFEHEKVVNVAQEYQKRIDYNFKAVPFSGNYFIDYILTGRFSHNLPMYLEPANLTKILKNLPRLTLEHTDLLSYLKSTPDNSFSKFNLSDIFEPLSVEANDALWEQVLRTAKNGARIVYWNNLVPRTFPKYLSGSITDETALAKRLHSQDRVFFYGNFYVHTVNK
ncbi:MAG: DUF3419 family protein [Candidatus Saccharibacteria bacterium]